MIEIRQKFLETNPASIIAIYPYKRASRMSFYVSCYFFFCVFYFLKTPYVIDETLSSKERTSEILLEKENISVF